MYLWNVFLVRPFAALSVLTCMAALYGCWSVVRKGTYQRFDRFLVGFVGLLAIFQGLRLLRDCGVLKLPANAQLNDLVELLITAFYLMATLILKLSSNDRMNADFELRLARAAPPKPLSAPGLPSVNPHPKDEILESFAWALPRLSDGAFKLYTYLCLHADSTSRKATVHRQDLLKNCGLTEAELTHYIMELETFGTSVVQSSDNAAEIQFLVPAFSSAQAGA